MSDPVDALTGLARRMFELGFVKYHPDPGGFYRGDSVYDQFRFADIETSDDTLFDEAVESVRCDPNFSGSQLDWRSTVKMILKDAARLAYMTGRSGQDERFEERFVGAVLDGYEDLRRFVRDGTTRVYTFTGLAGLDLPRDVTIATPWGRIYPLSPVAGLSSHSAPRPATVAMLVHTEDLPATAPEQRPGNSESSQRAKALAPLVFALTPVKGRYAAPTVTFQGVITPFVGGGILSSFTHWVNPFAPAVFLKEDNIGGIEELALLVEERQVPQMALACDRIVSALCRRSSDTDVLVDAVMAWESLRRRRA